MSILLAHVLLSTAHAAPVEDAQRHTPAAPAPTRPLAIPAGKPPPPPAGSYGPRPPPAYAPPPPPASTAIRPQDLPRRGLDRKKSVAMGLRAGSLLHRTYDGGLYADPGLGLFLRYRPVAALGLELSAQHHLGQRATHTMGSVSGLLFPFPRSKVSPYGVAGATATIRGSGLAVDLGDPELLWGGHVGGGLEFALGRKWVIDLDARYQGHFVNGGDDPGLPGALMAQAGLGVHF